MDRISRTPIEQMRYPSETEKARWRENHRCSCCGSKDERALEGWHTCEGCKYVDATREQKDAMTAGRR